MATTTTGDSPHLPPSQAQAYDRRRPETMNDCKMKPKMKDNGPNRAKRPANAFIIFQREFRKTNHMLNKVVNISRAASKEWYRLGPPGQAPYYAEYQKLMEIYNQNGNISNNWGNERKTTKLCSCDKLKPPLPVFFLFRQKFKEMHPEMKKITEIAKAAGKEWGAMSDTEKDPYIKEYQRQKKSYVEWKTRSAMPLQPDDTPHLSYSTTPGQISRRTMSRRNTAKDNELRDSVRKEIADLKKKLEELELQNKELKFENQDLQLKLTESTFRRLSQLEEKLLDLCKWHEEEVVLPCAREEVMSDRILRSSVTANKQVGSSSLLVASPDVVDKMKRKGEDKRPVAAAAAAARQKRKGEDKRPVAAAAAARQNRKDKHPVTAAAGAAAARQNAERNRRLQAATAASAARSVAVSRASRQRQPATKNRWV